MTRLTHVSMKLVSQNSDNDDLPKSVHRALTGVVVQQEGGQCWQPESIMLCDMFDGCNRYAYLITLLPSMTMCGCVDLSFTRSVCLAHMYVGMTATKSPAKETLEYSHL